MGLYLTQLYNSVIEGGKTRVWGHNKPSFLRLSPTFVSKKFVGYGIGMGYCKGYGIGMGYCKSVAMLTLWVTV